MSQRPPDAREGVPPGIPSDYYEHLYAVEQRHWWHRGMQSLSKVLLAERLAVNELAVLDAGCGTGGFLRSLIETGSFGRVCGVDVSPAAIQFARLRVPDAELYVRPLRELRFDDESFDLIVLNDVLQHVPEDEVQTSLRELRRVIRSTGTLLVRTNGAARARRERSDWRVYDRRTLIATLENAGFRCERVTYANLLGALWTVLRGGRLRAPTECSHGIPDTGGRLRNAVGSALLGLEGRYLRRPHRKLRFGHSLLAVAAPSS